MEVSDHKILDHTVWNWTHESKIEYWAMLAEKVWNLLSTNLTKWRFLALLLATAILIEHFDGSSF